MSVLGFPAGFRSRRQSLQVVLDRTLGTPIGNMTVGGGLAAAFDGVTAQTRVQSAAHPTNGSDGFVGKDWGVGVTRVVTGVVIYGSSDSGLLEIIDPLLSCQVRGHSAAPTLGTEGTLLKAFTVQDAAGVTHSELTNFTAAAFRYVWLWIDNSGASALQVAELQFYQTLVL